MPTEPKTSNVPYFLIVGGMAVVGVVAVVLVSVLRPEQDNSALITTIVGLLLPTTASILAFLKAQETHLSVNSRLDSFIVAAKAQAKAEGVKEGGRAANERTDKLKNND